MSSSILRRVAAVFVTSGLVFAGTTTAAHAATIDPTTLSIGVTPSTVAVGHLFQVSGTLFDTSRLIGAATETVVLYTRPTGTTAWNVLSTIRTDGGGGFATSMTATQSADFAAVYYGSSNLGVSVAGPVTETVSSLPAPEVTIGTDNQHVPKGTPFHLTSVVMPNAAGQTDQLQLLFGTTWTTIQSATLTANSTVVFTVPTGAKGDYEVRAFVASPDGLHGNGISPILILTVC